ncbi:MAG: hypothetical protein KIT09_28025 [Bryobacteraceae bacterium]|nr:hypothetical protein [Bryobacteraceae bacterium]
MTETWVNLDAALILVRPSIGDNAGVPPALGRRLGPVRNNHSRARSEFRLPDVVRGRERQTRAARRERWKTTAAVEENMRTARRPSRIQRFGCKRLKMQRLEQWPQRACETASKITAIISTILFGLLIGYSAPPENRLTRGFAACNLKNGKHWDRGHGVRGKLVPAPPGQEIRRISYNRAQKSQNTTTAMVPKAHKSKKRKRAYTRHNGVVQLAAKRAGCAPSTVYGVLHGRVKSKRIEQAIEEARAIIEEGERDGRRR